MHGGEDSERRLHGRSEHQAASPESAIILARTSEAGNHTETEIGSFSAARVVDMFIRNRSSVTDRCLENGTREAKTLGWTPSQVHVVRASNLSCVVSTQGNALKAVPSDSRLNSLPSAPGRQRAAQFARHSGIGDFATDVSHLKRRAAPLHHPYPPCHLRRQDWQSVPRRHHNRSSCTVQHLVTAIASLVGCASTFAC